MQQLHLQQEQMSRQNASSNSSQQRHLGNPSLLSLSAESYTLGIFSFLAFFLPFFLSTDSKRLILKGSHRGGRGQHKGHWQYYQQNPRHQNPYYFPPVDTRNYHDASGNGYMVSFFFGCFFMRTTDQVVSKCICICITSYSNLIFFLYIIADLFVVRGGLTNFLKNSKLVPLNFLKIYYIHFNIPIGYLERPTT